jgi:transcriptional regulator with XRE-family HTH domain
VLARVVVLDPEALGQRRNDLAHALRELRQRAGLSGDRLAARCGMSQSKISKIETGRVLPSLADVERLLTALNAPPGVVDEVCALARVANTEYADLRASLRRGLHHKQQELASFEANSSHIRFFLPTMLTGLLHTPEYARASLAPIPGDQGRAIAQRLERQEILYKAGKRFTFLLTEQAARWPLCEPAAMAVQIGRILALASLSNITVGIICYGGARVPEGPLNTFTVYDDRLVTAETFSGEIIMRDPRDVSYHLGLFETFMGYAARDDECRDILTAVQHDFMTQQETE